MSDGFSITDDGIYVDRPAFGNNACEIVLTRRAFVEAFKKWVIGNDSEPTVSKYQFQVGDIVTYIADDTKATLLDTVDEDGNWYVMTENGCIETFNENNFYKTGATNLVKDLVEDMQ